ncbi:phytoene desaturase family protein [Jatrophihabitans sp. YIM 134969]
MARSVVIGAGLGGLAAGARLAALGHAVTVLEASDTLGGKLGWHVETAPAGRFRYDTGPSLLTMPAVFEELFAATGDTLDSTLPVRRLSEQIRHRFADGTELTTSADPETTFERMDRAFGGSAADDWRELLARGGRMWDLVGERVVRRPLHLPTLIRSSASDLRTVAPGTSLRRFAKRLLHDPRQRMMLERYATYTGSDPRRSPATLATIPYLEQAEGIWYVDGGLHRLADALAARILERGGQIRTGAAVEQVAVAGGRADGVLLTDGSRLPADVVVSGIDAHRLYRSLVPDVARAPFADSLSGFTLLLGVRGRTPHLAHHNVLFGSTDYTDEFDAVFGAHARVVPDPVIYVSAPDDPAVRPAGHEAWFVLVNAARHGTEGRPGTLDWDTPGLATAYVERILNLLTDRGMAVRERLVSVAHRTPADLARRTGAPGGAIYGAADHGLRTTLRRPGSTSPLRGLFLVGGSVHPGGGLPLVATSAAIAATAIGPA